MQILTIELELRDCARAVEMEIPYNHTWTHTNVLQFKVEDPGEANEICEYLEDDLNLGIDNFNLE